MPIKPAPVLPIVDGVKCCTFAGWSGYPPGWSLWGCGAAGELLAWGVSRDWT
jgi:hypothetical protein